MKYKFKIKLYFSLKKKLKPDKNRVKINIVIINFAYGN